MLSCLGIYIEKNIIKYAKLSKEKDNIKVDAFGLKFYDRLDEAMEQIMTETDSYNIPISVNLSNESYQYFNVLSMIKGQDIQKVVKTEFEAYCYSEKINQHAFETRQTYANSLDEKDKIRVINVIDNVATFTVSLKTCKLMYEYRFKHVSGIFMFRELLTKSIIWI